MPRITHDALRDSESCRQEISSAGVVALRGLFGPTAVEAMGAWFSDIMAQGRDIPENFDPQFELGTDAVRKLRRIFWNDEDFWSGILNDAGLPALASRLVGAPVALTFHASFLKPAEVGTPVALHQDQALWKHDYPNAISVWVALTPARRHNGCLIGCPGSHLRGAIAHTDIPGHPWHGGIDWRSEALTEPVPYELEAGDALIWDRYFVHGSGSNHSTEPRWGMVMVFVDRTCSQLRTTDRADF